MPLTASVSRKLTKIGLWIKCIAYLHRGILTLSKNQKSNQIYSEYDIKSKAKILFSSESHKTILIKIANETSISLKFDSAEMAEIWENQLIKQSKINIPKIQHICVLGQGAFSTVKLAKFEDQFFALKIVQKQIIQKFKLEKNAASERDCMIICKHPFIVEFRFCFQDISSFSYGMEFLPGGDLFSLMKQNKNISFIDKTIYLAEIGLALTHIHSKGFVYRDLKPENILISKDGHLKICDFGLSINIEEEGYTNGIVGTPAYIAPEILQGLNYDFGCDWWSFGILAYEILCNEMPYSDENRSKLYWKIKNVSPKFPSELDYNSQHFISLFLKKNPKQRATFISTKEHPFWNGLKIEDVLMKQYSPQFVPNLNNSTEKNFQKYFIESKKPKNIKAEKNVPNLIYPLESSFSFISDVK
jgi:serine/threonine protein kinase